MDSRPEGAAGEMFGTWVRGLWRQRFAQVAALITTANVLLSVAKQFKLDKIAGDALEPLSLWFDTISHALQAIVILILLGVLYRCRYARPKDAHHEPCRFGYQVQSKFYEYWRHLWFAWFLLYMVMAGYGFAFRSKIDQIPALERQREVDIRVRIQEVEDGKEGNAEIRWVLTKEIHPILLYQDLISNALNNFQTLFFFCCYFILLCRRDPSTTGPETPPVAYFSLFVFILSFSEFIGIIGGVHQHNLEIFRWLSAFAAGVGLAMLVGRLESRRFNAPLWVIFLLYFYAVSQTAWALGGTGAIDPIFRSIMFTLFLVLKIVLFLYVLWLLQSGRMLYYIISVVQAERHDERSRQVFLNEKIVCQ